MSTGGQQLGISAETLRGWVSRDEIDTGERPGIPTETAARVAELEREVIFRIAFARRRWVGAGRSRPIQLPDSTKPGASHLPL